jgi:hypothetical protein
MIVKVELTEPEIMTAIADYIMRKVGVEVATKSLFVEVKSKQNYKSEWEQAAMRVSCDVHS